MTRLPGLSIGNDKPKARVYHGPFFVGMLSLGIAVPLVFTMPLLAFRAGPATCRGCSTHRQAHFPRHKPARLRRIHAASARAGLFRMPCETCLPNVCREHPCRWGCIRKATKPGKRNAVFPAAYLDVKGDSRNALSGMMAFINRMPGCPGESIRRPWQGETHVLLSQASFS